MGAPGRPRPTGTYSGARPGGSPSAPGSSPAPPTTLSLVISRRARREAAGAAAAAARPPDPRLEVIEHVFTGLHVAGNVFVLALSAVGWLWLAVHRAAASVAGGQVAAGAADAAQHLPASGLSANPLLQPLATASGATLVLIMLATCLLMAPVVNPFYAPPDERRLLHTTTTLLFGVLAVTTVAVIAGAAR